MTETAIVQTLLSGTSRVVDASVYALGPTGTMDVLTKSVSGLHVDDQAGTRDRTDRICDNTGSIVPKFAVIAAASSGNNTLVAAVSDKKLRVLALTLSASAAVNAKFQSAAGGTDLTGLYYLAANGGVVLPYNKLGWFETAASALLNLNLSAAVAVGGCLTYIEVA
jgi:hypothetical protein